MTSKKHIREGFSGVQLEFPFDIAELEARTRTNVKRYLPLDPPEHNLDEVVIVSTGNGIIEDLPIIRELANSAAVFGLKEAVHILRQNGISVDYSVCMDPQDNQVDKVLPVYTDLTYLMSAYCSPNLFDEMDKQHARVLLYYAPVLQEDWPNLPVFRDGLMTGEKAIHLARAMGAKKITLSGFQLGWRSDTFNGYAEGTVGKSAGDHLRIRDRGILDGQEWFTRPDLLITAINIAGMIKRNEVEVLGDSLAIALSKHDDNVLQKMVEFK